MTQLLLHGGASTVTVVERSEAKRNLAEKFGAVGCRISKIWKAHL